MPVVRRALRELRFLNEARRMLAGLRAYAPDGEITVTEVFERRVDRAPDAVALVFEEQAWTWRELDQAANRVADWARWQAIGRGDVVALLMENRPEFIATWLGLAKVGAVSALLNTNLHAHGLAHCIRVSGARRIVVGAELAEAWASAQPLLESPPQAFACGGAVAGADDLDAALARASTSRPIRSVRGCLRPTDDLFYIYTSGTTGHPKAARFSHLRFLQVGYGFASIARATPRDRIYCALPLYHTAGGVVTVSSSWHSGAALVLRRKFSASQFWNDCRAHGVTIFQYIGELCRYLLAQPEHADDRRHRVRCAVGNGLRPDIWERFQTRFGIARIVEFYGSTEGNVALVNFDGKVGAVGRLPAWAKSRMPTRLVRFDVEAETHPRGPDGFCIECAPGEIGEAIGQIPADPKSPVGRFEGYTGKAETEKKILRDVFEKGDAWFRSGDLLRQDDEGYLYFVDRIGDTFRWKGENVATTEVAECLAVFPGVEEANVYGVEVPGCEGRAGMAAIVADDDLDLDALHRHLAAELPRYAQPLFLRRVAAIEITGTFKHRKVELVREGFAPETCPDPVWLRDDAAGRFVPIDTALAQRIADGKLEV